MRPLIVVPMKQTSAAKSRLSPILDQDRRYALARMLYRRTLAWLSRERAHVGCDIAVVTACADAALLARQHDVSLIAETVPTTLSAAVARAASWAAEAGYQRLCILPADLAEPDAADLATLLRCDSDVALAPSADRGTNAMALTLPTRMRFHYGPNSAARHIRAAGTLGLTASFVPLESLKHDIDTETCLRRAAQSDSELASVFAQA
ncbi:MAG: 2-phospho-L-lactate guanylyltransferase [Pseudomonadota bacterium]